MKSRSKPKSNRNSGFRLPRKKVRAKNKRTPINLIWVKMQIKEANAKPLHKGR